MATIYSVSYMATKDDNGSCSSFSTRFEAERERLNLIADGCWFVSAVWVS